MRTPANLDVFSCRLDGVNLIEASAGTGKTWNICGLYLRLLLESALKVQDILVVTFTNAATAELRERIRQRILDTLAYLNNTNSARADADPFVPMLVERLRSRRGSTNQDSIDRLALALATFDEAAIFTIHGFCQRALADTPFTARMPLTLELLQDDSELLQEVANDFWRRHLAADTLDPALAAYLVQRGDTPNRFARLLQRQMAKTMATNLWPRDIDAPGAPDAAALADAHAQARAQWTARRDAIVKTVLDALPSLNANSYKADSVNLAAAEWDAILNGDDPLAALQHEGEKFALFGLAKLVKSTKNNQTTPTDPFFIAGQGLLDALHSTRQTLKLMRLRLLRELLEQGSRSLHQAKRARRVVAFDDMLFNLHQRLCAADGGWLAGSLRARFPAALVDEFQDTDPLQFAIFKAVYGAGDAPLFLVGDPKQAIYSFRNADLHTYLQAREQASAEYTLVENQRSSKALIDALNGLFGNNPHAFMLPGLEYRQVGMGARPRKMLVDRTEARAALQIWTLPTDPAHGTPVLRQSATQAVVRATAAEIARLLTGAQQGRVTLDAEPMRAGDIAILVRTHREGALMRQALGALRVGSVELSQSSIFRTVDAEELDRLLAAVLEPSRERLVRGALSTELMGLDAAALDALSGNESGTLEVLQRFAALRGHWLGKGVGAMLREWLTTHQVAERMLRRADGERRLTNLLHLIECLHEAAQTHPAPDALLRWFQAQRGDERADDSTQLRLESDQNLVQIVTIHRAKGLEYPIVFCPFLWGGRARSASDGLDGIEYHDMQGSTVIDFRNGFANEYDDKTVKAGIKLDASAEFLRLVYVALTRAMHRCVLVAGCYGSKTSGNISYAESTHSLLNWLVAGGGMAPQDWFSGKRTPDDIAAAWTALVSRCAPNLALSPLPMADGVPIPPGPVDAQALAALPAPATPWIGWWIGSYSGLAHGAVHEQAAVDHDLRARPAAQATLAAALDLAATAPEDILRFPRGAQAGECMHAVFEQIDFTDPSTWPSAIASAMAKLRPATSAAAAAADASADLLQTRMLAGMLHDVLNTPLPVGTASPLLLAQLPLARRLTEMEFHLPAHGLESGALNQALARFGYPMPRLGFATLRGFLKGFIDLVFEHQGRYFILDWKSNYLGSKPQDYATQGVSQAMAEQGYHLQHLLYSVALERHLHLRLPGYRPELHFGGVLYLFVRGVRPTWRAHDGSPAGLYFHRAQPRAIAHLSNLLDPIGLAA